MGTAVLPEPSVHLVFPIAPPGKQKKIYVYIYIYTMTTKSNDKQLLLAPGQKLPLGRSMGSPVVLMQLLGDCQAIHPC